MGHRHGFNRQDVARVFDDALQFVGRRHSHGDVIFLVAGGGDRIYGSGMGQHFVFANQGCRGDLRHHETGVQSCALGKKGRQALTEGGIHEAFDAALADTGQGAERDG